MSQLFKATRGKIAIKRTSGKTDKSGVIIYEQADHDKIKTGVVVSVGDPEILENGTEIACLVEVGDHIVYTLEQGFVSFGGFDMIQQKSVIGMCPEGTVIQ